MTSPIAGKVQTVLGPIDPADLGITLTHEHLLIDLAGYSEQPEAASHRGLWDRPYTMDLSGRFTSIGFYIRDGLQLFSEQEALDEVRQFMLAGGGSLVDATNWDLGRDPLALARISRAAGLHVVMGSGHYVPSFRPDDMDERSEESIAERLVGDVTLGVGDTGIKAGIIGEIGNVHPGDDGQRKVLRAAAHAQQATGAPILIHPGIDDTSAPEILEVLARAGADLTRVIMGHLDYSVRDPGYLRAVAETGCFMEYDTFGMEDTGLVEWGVEVPIPTDAERIATLEFLVEQGYEDRLLLAQDVCLKYMQARTGGHGFAHVVESIVPRMRKRGFSADQIDGFLVRNPARAHVFA